MAKEYSRSERVADAVQRELAVLIRDEVRDPRVGMVSITDVDISRDLAYGKIYISFVGDRDDDDIKAAVAALNGASGYLRKLLAAQIKLRITPTLTFFYDDSGRRGEHLSALIDYAVASDVAAADEVNGEDDQ
ncbi:30S ribosome-binding factor RbfA [Porticoccaceae bacterium]|nr:30S ribosome-binding factor RbfA [Porticoccaceae bacterium]